MKKYVITLALFTGFISAFAQDIRFEHPGGRASIVSKTKLAEAAKVTELGMQDLSKAYKMAEVEIMSVNITVTDGKNNASASGTSDELTPAQKEILISAAQGAEICVRMNYKFKTANRYGDTLPRFTEYALTPGPAVEAEFPGGQDGLLAYVKESLTGKFTDKEDLKVLANASVAFVVNEQGQVVEPTLYRSTGDKDMDILVIKTIKDMPAWKPAEYTKGVRVKQKFIVSIPAQKIVSPKSGEGC